MRYQWNWPSTLRLSRRETVSRHACALDVEGLVSKWKDSAYRSGRSPAWLKMRNADAPAVKREAEEDWGKESWR